MMLKLAILLVAAAGVLDAGISYGMLPHSNGGRIVGGISTTISTFPWQVSLQQNGDHACGASIYNSNSVITAAHCVHKVAVNVLRIRVGSSFWHSGGVSIPVVAYLIHEEYNDYTMQNDIAIMRLESSLTFSSNIRPIPLASVPPPSGAPTVISGWGVIDHSANSTPTILQYINTYVVSSADCGSSKFGYGSVIDQSMICAASAGKDACQNDSGGPMVAGGELVGVVSWGTGCASNNFPGVYANVAVLKSWVEKAVETI